MNLSRKPKISIIGSGKVGSASAWAIAHQQLANLVLVDIASDLAKGVALDISQSLAINSIDIDIQATGDFARIQDSDIVVITAGIPRKPGMSRLDLLAQNMKIVRNIFSHIVKHSPQAIVIMVTNPIDLIGYYAHQITQIPSNRLIGMTGVLDSGRLKSFICKELGVHPRDVNAMVLGGHGDDMLIVPEYTTVAGVSIAHLMSEEQIQRLTHQTQHAGAEIVNLFKTGSAYFAPGNAVAHMVNAVISDSESVLPASCLLNGTYEINDMCLGTLIRLGKKGICNIIEAPLTSIQKKVIQKTAQRYQDNIKDMRQLSPDLFKRLD